MLDSLSQRFNTLGDSFSSVFGDNRTINEEALDTVCKNLRRILLEADVSLSVAQRFLVSFKTRVLGEKVYEGLDAEQHLIGLLNESLVELLGQHHEPLKLEEASTSKPAIILLFGLQGSGKTTTAGKLAKHLLETRQATAPFLIAADTHRPAAAEQLRQLGERIGVTVYQEPENPDMQAIVEAGLKQAQSGQHDVVIVDTAGRQEVAADAMADLLLLERSISPSEKLLVIDAMMGQQAVAVAKAFHAQLNLSGLVLTKLDGDARGGAVLSVVEATGCPIKLVGVGEGVDDLEAFHPDRMAGRMLGQGDVISLFEKAQTRISQKETKKLQERLFSETGMSFNDYLSMQKLLSRLGSLEQIMGMLPIPGLSGDLKKQLASGNRQESRQFQALVNSMTPAERDNPDMLAKPRVARIAKGCGLSQEEAEALLKPFYYQRHMFSQLSGMMKLFGGGGSTGGNSPLDALFGGGSKKSSKPAPQVPTEKREMTYDPLTGKVKRKK